jgi:hypothetical protein
MRAILVGCSHACASGGEANGMIFANVHWRLKKGKVEVYHRVPKRGTRKHRVPLMARCRAKEELCLGRPRQMSISIYSPNCCKAAAGAGDW